MHSVGYAADGEIPTPSVLIPKKGCRAHDERVHDSPGGALINDVRRIERLVALSDTTLEVQRAELGDHTRTG